MFALVAFMPPAQAGASWRSVASGYAIGRGTWGNPDVSIQGTTGRNPDVLRFHIEGKGDQSTNVSWYVRCWNGNDPFNDVTASGSFSSTPPITVISLLSPSRTINGTNSTLTLTTSRTAYSE